VHRIIKEDMNLYLQAAENTL